MSEIASTWLTILPDTSRIAPGIRAAMRGETADVDVRVDRRQVESEGSNAAAFLSKGLKTAAVASGGAIAAVFGAALTKGFTRLKSIDEAQSKLAGLGNSAEQVQKIMDSANAAVKGTAFGLGDAATVAASAVAAGVKPGAELQRTLTLVGDAAAIAGSDLGEMGAIFNKVATSNKVQGEELAQLGDRGIPIVQLLAKELGVTAGEVTKLASEGKIGFAEFQNAIEKGMGGAAQKMGTTFQGAIANVGAALGRVGAKILQPLFNAIIAAAPAVQAAVDQVGKYIEPAFDVIGNVLSGAFDAFRNVIDFVSRNGTVFGTIGAAIGGVAAVIGVALLPALAAWLWRQTAINGLLLVVRGLVLAQAAATKIATAATWLWNTALRANPIGLIITAIAGLAAGLAFFFTKTETGRKLWDQIWGGIKSVTQSVVSWFTGTAWPAIQSGLRVIGDVAMWLWHNVMQPVWTGIKAVIGIAWTGIKGYFTLWQTAIRAVATVVTWLWKNVVTPAFSGIKAVLSVFWAAAQVVWEALKLAIRVVGGVIMWLWNNVAVPAFQGIGVVISAAWQLLQPIFAAFKAAIDVVGNVISWLWNNVAVPGFNAIRDTASAMWDKISPIWDNFKKGLEVVIDWGTKFKDKLVEAFNVVKDTVTAVWDKIGGILDKIKSGLSGAADALKKINPFGGGGDGGGDGKGFASGGYTGRKPTNAVAGVVHGDEYVVRSAARRRFERDHPGALDTLNSTGQLPGYAGGGLVAGATQVKDFIARRFGVKDIGGYRPEDGYGEHSTGRALDVMVGNDTKKGDAITQWAISNASALDVKWVIWKQAMHYPDGRVVPMEDRGSPTQNHMDHPHIFLGPAAEKGYPGLGGLASSKGREPGSFTSGGGTGSGGGGLSGGLGAGGGSGLGSGSGSGGGGSYSSAAAAKKAGIVPVWVENWPGGGIGTGGAAGTSSLSSEVSSSVASVGAAVKDSALSQTAFDKKVQAAEKKLADKQAAAELARTKLAETKANPKAKGSALMAAEQRVTKAERDATDAQTALDELKKAATAGADPSKVAAAQKKLADKQAAVELARTKLAETKGNPKAKESAVMAAEQRVTKAERDAADAKAVVDALATKPAAPAATAAVGGAQGYADAIVAEGLRKGVSKKGILAALATVQVETGFKMYASSVDRESLKYRHDAVGSDHDSSGLFQQRANGAWGTVADRMDPAKSAGMFYDQLLKFDYESMDIGNAAQKVQRSAFPDKYGKQVGVAEKLLADSMSRLKESTDGSSSATTDLTTATDTQTAAIDGNTTATQNTGGGAEKEGEKLDLGEVAGDGIMEILGFDGSLFSNPFEWKTLQGILNLFGADSATNPISALANIGNGPLFAGKGTDTKLGEADLGSGGGGNLLAAAGQLATEQFVPGKETQAGTQDLSINFNGNVGMNPQDVTTEMSKKQNARARTYEMAGAR